MTPRRLRIVRLAVIAGTLLFSVGFLAPASALANWYTVNVHLTGGGDVQEGSKHCGGSGPTMCSWSYGTALFGYGIGFAARNTAAGWRFTGWSNCPKAPSWAWCPVDVPGGWASGGIDIWATYGATSVGIPGGPPEGTFVSNSNPVFGFAAGGPVDGAVRYWCAIDGSGLTDCGTSGTFATSLGDGAHTLTVEGTDNDGTIGWASRHWTIDTRAPGANITQAPPGLDDHSSATFRFAADEDGVRWVCRQFAATAPIPDWSDCAPGVAYDSLGDGDHVFQVAAIDRAGNWSLVREHRWTVDVTAPTVRILSGPSRPTNSRRAQFTFTSGDAVSVSCALDGRWADCGSATSTAYDDLNDGTHTFSVRGRDAAGNVSTATTSWRVDTQPPRTRILSAPSALTADTTARVGFVATEPATFRCVIDGRAPVGCRSPWIVGGLTVGAHEVRVQATDEAGNIELSPPIVRWRQSVDRDGDGYLVEQDCDDTNPAIHPGAHDIPDNHVDENCDGHDARFPRLAADAGTDFLFYATYVAITSVHATGVPAGATVTFTCRGRGCQRPVKIQARRSGRIELLRRHREMDLRPGATLKVRITKACAVGKAITIRVLRLNHRPSKSVRSVPPRGPARRHC